MSLPGDLGTVVLTGEFLDPAGNPMRGTVTIYPNATLTDATGNVIVSQVQRAYQLFNGTFRTAPLVATDNTDINPQGFAYVVNIALQEVETYQFTVLLPTSGTPIDLSALSPAVSVPEVAGALPVTGGVLTGKLTLDGTIPLQIPAGASAGDVLTSDASGNASWEPVSAELPAATTSSQGAIELAADLGGTATAPHVVATHLASALSIAQGGTGSGTQNFSGLLTETAVKTSAYTAAPGDFVCVDTTSGAVTVTLPNAPADLTVVAVKMVASAATPNAVTINCAGSDVINKTGGSTNATLTLLEQSSVFQYQHSTGIWLKQTGDVPLTQLDGRYVRPASPTMTGSVTIDDTVTQTGAPLVVKGAGTSSNTKTYFYQYSASAQNQHRFRRSRGTPSALSAVQNGDKVHFNDWSAYDGADVASADSDGHGYGGGVAEENVSLDMTPPQAGSGHTPGRWVLGVTSRYGDPTGSTSIPARDAGPADQLQMTSFGYFDVGAGGTRGVTIPNGTILAATGDLLVAPMAAPGTPTVTAIGNVGSAHTYTYKIVPVGAGNVDGPPSAASNTVSNDVLNGSGASLDWRGRATTATIYNSVQPAGLVGGAMAYRLLVSVDSGAYQYLYTYHVGGLAHFDDGSVTAASYTPATASPGGHVLLRNVAADPASTPSGGGILYSVGAALKFKGSDGSVTQLGPVPGLASQATATDFALQNGTPVVCQWTTPNDGVQHRVAVFSSENVTTALAASTGQVSLQWFYKGSQGSAIIFTDAATVGTHVPQISGLIMADPNTVVRLIQAHALTSTGAATISAEIWGS